MITKKDYESYKKSGYLIIKEAFEHSRLEQIKIKVDSLAHQVLKQEPITEAHQSYRGSYIKLSKSNRIEAGKIFDTLKKIPEVNRLCYSLELEQVAQILLSSQLVLASPTQQNLRSDMPGETNFLYPWHTDYDYNLSSSNGLTFGYRCKTQIKSMVATYTTRITLSKMPNRIHRNK